MIHDLSQIEEMIHDLSQIEEMIHDLSQIEEMKTNRSPLELKADLLQGVLILAEAKSLIKKEQSQNVRSNRNEQTQTC